MKCVMKTKTKMKRTDIIVAAIVVLVFGSCNIPKLKERKENRTVPSSYFSLTDTTTVAEINWRSYFGDSLLTELIDTALVNNQELNIMMQEIEISRNEVRARKGEYLPSVKIGAASGMEKAGRYTRNGAVEEQLEVRPGEHFPEPLGDHVAGVYASWEIDIWRKLRNSKDAAMNRYLASIEGRNFMVTNLISEIAGSYYELMALDNQLKIIEQNIVIQSSALNIARQQKEAAKVTQLAVNRFEAQLLHTQSMEFEVKQQIVETENRINFLTGRFPKPIKRNSDRFLNMKMDSIEAGIPSQLLVNRPDIRQAELQLKASRLDVKAARAEFYPSVRLTAGAGFQAFNPAYLVNPESMIYNLAGDLIAPVVNRNAIQANYLSSGAKQVQAAYVYEQTVVGAFIDVINQLSRIQNYSAGYTLKAKEVAILDQSVTIANNLFLSARADYSEVLLTQREALDSRMELVELQMKQQCARVSVYRALGGGWR